jgi:hypothetical protein
MTVDIPPPINPSTVLLGLSLINFVLPIVFPNTYAITSLTITDPLVIKSQKNPL